MTPRRTPPVQSAEPDGAGDVSNGPLAGPPGAVAHDGPSTEESTMQHQAIRPGRPTGPHPAPRLAPEEVAALTELWAAELRRGWIPKPSDIADALEVLRRR